MDYIVLKEMRDLLAKNKDKISPLAFQSFEKNFEINYTHNSTAIEGNTLTLIETKLLLEDNISVGGKNLRETFEVVNHAKAFNYIKKCIVSGEILTEAKVKDIHAILMENIFAGGIYRNCEVRITGAKHKPPAGNEMYSQIKEFFSGLPKQYHGNAIELAAYTHAEFVRIHPFEDGNGRTARLIMNYQLMAQGFLPVSIAKENRLEYFETLEQYAVNKDLKPFSRMIASLEKEQLLEYLTLLPSQNLDCDCEM